MNLYQEIAALKKSPRRASDLAELLLETQQDWTEWERQFLEDMSLLQHPVSTLQGEKLIELRNATTRKSTLGTFSARELIRKCHMLRDEFQDGEEDDQLADYIATLVETECYSLTDPQWKRLIVAAKRCGEIERYVFVV